VTVGGETVVVSVGVSGEGDGLAVGVAIVGNSEQARAARPKAAQANPYGFLNMSPPHPSTPVMRRILS
jgi:hypothetical protein